MPEVVPLADIALYHNDAESSLRLFFSKDNPTPPDRFVTYLSSEIQNELKQRLVETEMRSALVILARIEAALRTDYIERWKLKMPDNVSIAFRKIYRNRGKRARLEEDILEVWAQNLDTQGRQAISELRGMLKFRHWLAHGRYWNLGRKYGFQDTYLLASAIIGQFPLHS